MKGHKGKNKLFISKLLLFILLSLIFLSCSKKYTVQSIKGTYYPSDIIKQGYTSTYITKIELDGTGKASLTIKGKYIVKTRYYIRGRNHVAMSFSTDKALALAETGVIPSGNAILLSTLLDFRIIEVDSDTKSKLIKLIWFCDYLTEDDFIVGFVCKEWYKQVYNIEDVKKYFE